MPPETRTITAHYTSPTASHKFSIPVTAPGTNTSTAERTRYLGEFLTEKMEEDKAREAGSKNTKKEEEEREEENYGEEQAEDED
ncbi:uncharacterized protein AB675_11631 [Cyphellophora attinorum]|uniref:EKC/KEOPS complex subunit GON7 n=1 Tax=Cyphellophora attinorum TaxID=1664694 RepID=A0A0N1NXN9_9EURO|nr:uncharacterized protein AB675_11631 [Phialophora attinorum]KPI34644.1 hypothetical protein AB675_11631 [Phialophora attinorum]